MAGDDEIGYLSVEDLRRLIDAREVKVEEVLRAVLDRSERVNPRLNAIVANRAEKALSEARAIDSAPAKDAEHRPLHGIPWTAKDMVETEDMPLTLGSVPIARGGGFDYDSVLVGRMRRAGAILWGKTNVPEWGLRPTTENRIFGPTGNPWSLAHNAGGSSGGAAAAAAAGLGPLHQGGDGGGSCRIPASCCGVVGYKPSRGLVPVGPIARELWAGLVSLGPLARTVRDAALMLDAIAGYEPGDPYAAPTFPTSFRVACDAEPRRLRVAYQVDSDRASVDPGTRSAFLDGLEALEGLGHEVVEAGPDLSGLAEPWLRIVEANVAALMGAIEDVQLTELEASTVALGHRGLAMPASEYCAAVDAARLESGRVMELWREHDVLATPTLTRPAPRNEEMPEDHDLDSRWREYLDWLAWTFPLNVTGQPAISVPCGLDPSGLPVGLQLVGDFGRDDLLFGLAAAFEGTGTWDAAARPPIS